MKKAVGKVRFSRWVFVVGGQKQLSHYSSSHGPSMSSQKRMRSFSRSRCILSTVSMLRYTWSLLVAGSHFTFSKVSGWGVGSLQDKAQFPVSQAATNPSDIKTASISRNSMFLRNLDNHMAPINCETPRLRKLQTQPCVIIPYVRRHRGSSRYININTNNFQ